MILSPALRPVHALIPNDVMPKWWRTGRQGQRPSLISPISSKWAIVYSLIDTPPVVVVAASDRSPEPNQARGVQGHLIAVPGSGRGYRFPDRAASITAARSGSTMS